MTAGSSVATRNISHYEANLCTDQMKTQNPVYNEFCCNEHSAIKRGLLCIRFVDSNANQFSLNEHAYNEVSYNEHPAVNYNASKISDSSVITNIR